MPAQDTPDGRTEVPFQLFNNDLVVVRAAIGSLRNVNMIVDTGTSPTSISKEIAHRLKLSRRAESLRTLNGVIPAESAVVPGVDFGPLHAGSMRVVVQDLSFMERSMGIPLGGIIGLDVLSSGCFTIDYPKKRIAFGAIPADFKTTPLATRVPRPTIRARIGGQEVRLLVDSGTSGLVVYRNRLREKATATHFDPGASLSTSGGLTRLTWLKASVSIGEENLGKREIAIADVDSDLADEFDGLMGFAKMGFRRVSFDFENAVFGWD
jgi:predicted aspartyl protease